MKISFTGAPEWMDRNVGYGEASNHIFNSFRKAGLECTIKDKSANIGISFIQPPFYTFASHQYKIGYTPWESTEVFKNWLTPMNYVVDEIWATSEWVADVFSKHTDKPIFVYEHGVDESWIPVKREIDSSRPFRFLHIGEPSSRKDAQTVVDVFVNLYGNNPNYELILKCTKLNSTAVFDPNTGQVLGSPELYYKNIRVIESMLSVEQMNGLYNLCDVLVYPSWGEGFGFIPLQAMASGMPTICTEAWAPYGKYITMPLDSVLTPSPWQITHPGLMLKPSYSQLKYFMEDAQKKYEKYAELAYKNAFLIHKKYNWDAVSKPAIERLKKIEKEHF